MVRHARPRGLPPSLGSQGPGLVRGDLRRQAGNRNRQFVERGHALQRRTCGSWQVHVKRGVLAAGGFPLEFPTISLGEFFLSPTSMYCRNLMSMDVEEMIRGLPIDGVVLLSGCDKTTPAMLMGAASADLPAILLTARSAIEGKLARRGTRLLHRLPPLLVGTTRWNDHPGRVRLHGRGHLQVPGGTAW